MLYVLRRIGDGKFVCPPGNHESYSAKLQHARGFESREEAQREACGNDEVLPLDSLVQRDGK